MTTLEEHWRPPHGLPGYEVSSLGRIRSSHRKGGWRILRLSRSRYPSLSMLDANGSEVTRYIHRLVLETFVGPCPPGKQACHVDGCTSNNRVSNLRWGTPVENAADRKRHGNTVRGSRVIHSKMTATDVRWMLWARAYTGISGMALGRAFGISQAAAYKIITRRVWRDLSA
jgi:hypothetical protein